MTDSLYHKYLKILTGNSLNEASNSLTIIQSKFVYTDFNAEFNSSTQFFPNALKSLPVIVKKNSNSLTIIESKFVNTDSNAQFESPTLFIPNLKSLWPTILKFLGNSLNVIG